VHVVVTAVLTVVLLGGCASARGKTVYDKPVVSDEQKKADEAACTRGALDTAGPRGAVYLAVDRSPSMGLYPEASPWLSKPRAVAAAATLIAASARAESCPFGVLDEHGVPRLEPVGRSAAADALVRGIRYDRRGGLAALLADVARPSVPAGCFVFLLSDFVAPVEAKTWQRALTGGIELVPVVIQDRLLERSFPDVGSIVVPTAEPGGRRTLVRLSRRQARELREHNERRLEELAGHFHRLGLDWVDVASDDLHDLHGAFFTWADARRAREAA